MSKKIQFTKAGHQKINSELKELTELKHPAAKDRLSKARAMGDLKENSEYHAAKDDLGTIVGRIAELEEMLRWAEIVDDAVVNLEDDLVRLGCKVIIDKNGQRDQYHIVGEYEVDPMIKKISHTSPIGKALMGKKKGDIVEVVIPSGKHIYTIIDIKQS